MEAQKLIKRLKLINLILSYTVVGIVFTFGFLYYLDTNVLTDEVTDIQYKETEKYVPEALKRNARIKIPNEAQNISISYDHNYISYIVNSVITIKDLRNDKIIKEIKDDNKIISSVFVNDRNLILYFIEKDTEIKKQIKKQEPKKSNQIEEYYSEVLVNNEPVKVAVGLQEKLEEKTEEKTEIEQELYVMTYDLDKEESTEHVNFPVKDLSKIKQVEFSSLTNVIYVNLEIKKDEKKSDKIYRIDIMKNVKEFQTANEFKKIVLLSHEDKLIVEDDNNNIYINRSLLKNSQYKKLDLLGNDAEDYYYIRPTGIPGIVIKMKNKTTIEEKIILDTSYTGTFNSKENVYLIFNNYIWLIDYKGRPVAIKTTPKNKLIDIFDNVLYELEPNGVIVQVSTDDRRIK